MNKKSIPSLNEAEELLNWAEKLNPGLWIKHSKNTARVAKIIASSCSMDENKAYIMGLLHDIGRYEGIKDLHHVISGYELMMKKGYQEIARICLIHSFPIKNINSFSGQNDCSNDEILVLSDFLSNIVYNDYDKLIQLCDALSSHKGIVLIETRLFDVAKRRGINEFTIEKWSIFEELKDYFSLKCGINIYKLFYEEICNNIL